MYVQTLLEKKTGRRLIMLVEGYREHGKVKHRTIERIGYLDEFTDLYEDPIEHFKHIAKQRTAEKKQRQQPVTIELMPEALLAFDERTRSYDCVKNIGYAAISKIFHRLGIHKFFDDRRKYLDISYNLTSVVKLLVYERMIAPGSKRAAWMDKHTYFDKMDFDLNAVYRSLSILARYREDVLHHLHAQMVKHYHRDSTLLFYDVTNYYFEIDNEDSFRRKGFTKEHRPNPIVQMGLFMDGDGFPITYDLFAGNTNDCTTFTPMSEKLRSQLHSKHLIFVADKAMMSGTNIADVIMHHNGYIFSKAVRGATQVLKDIARDPRGYICFDEHGKLIAETDTKTPVAFKYKILDEVKDTGVTTSEGTSKKVKGVGHYQIIYWSHEYAKRAQLDRAAAVEKAMVAAMRQSKDVIDNNHGKNQFLTTEVYDARTKEKIQEYEAKVVFDASKLAENESLDGYYVIETNVTGWRECVDARGHATGELEQDFGRDSRWLAREGMLQLNREVTPLDIVGMYHQLWKIEQTFRVTKTELDARPVYVSREDRIGSHFLICFIALLIVRILEHELAHAYSSEKILTSLRKANVVELNSTTFKTLYYDEVLQNMKEALNIPFGMNIYTRKAIRSMLADTKKTT
jgi:transposase